ncbi:MAG: HU family DNA-binding protein [Thermoproteota archaeon]
MNTKLIDDVSTKTGFTKKSVRETLIKLQDAIIERLTKDGFVQLGQIGILRISQRGAKKVRNLKTGEIVEVPPRKTVILKCGKKLKEIVNAATS